MVDVDGDVVHGNLPLPGNHFLRRPSSETTRRGDMRQTRAWKMEEPLFSFVAGSRGGKFIPLSVLLSKHSIVSDSRGQLSRPSAESSTPGSWCRRKRGTWWLPTPSRRPPADRLSATLQRLAAMLKQCRNLFAIDTRITRCFLGA